jgi:hypothetical protein
MDGLLGWLGIAVRQPLHQHYGRPIPHHRRIVVLRAVSGAPPVEGIGFVGKDLAFEIGLDGCAATPVLKKRA